MIPLLMLKKGRGQCKHDFDHHNGKVVRAWQDGSVDEADTQQGAEGFVVGVFEDGLAWTSEVPNVALNLGDPGPFFSSKKRKVGAREKKKKATNVEGKQKAKAKAKAKSKGKDKAMGEATPKAKAKPKAKPKEPDPGAEVDQAVQDVHDVFVSFAAYTEHCYSSMVCSVGVYMHGYNITGD